MTLAPGIYFKLPSEIYHKDPALSRSNLVDLLDTPFSYWVNSWMNPNRKEKKKTVAMNRGSAFDCLLFEPQLFKKRYQIVPIDPWDASKLKIELEKYTAIIESIKVLRAGKDSGMFLSGGIPHVTIVFDWGGYRFRCEHDYFMFDCSSDFKSVHSLEDWHIKNSFRDYGLDIQMALYKKSRAEFKRQYAAGQAHVFGAVDPAFFKKFIECEKNEFLFLFQRESEPYPYRPIFPEDDTEDSGLTKIDKAISIYAENLRKYGTDKPWPVCSGEVEIFSMFFGKR